MQCLLTECGGSPRSGLHSAACLGVSALTLSHSLPVKATSLGPFPSEVRSYILVGERGLFGALHVEGRAPIDLMFLPSAFSPACTDTELRSLASRLKDWFGALHEDANRAIEPTSMETAQGSKMRYSC